ncbi:MULTISPECIES: TrmB family transcriptional regulator [unclassified Methanosarcina]|uniref:TrmB family transcriptional regulator n=1 Tax=unclassified Methanosarcina TaxID=2644672 RepID=UPI000615D78F|nr:MULTISPECIES: TrmB family transcriptional regulator [unclassified Methanosarcina]AKB18305.1 Transcriptional regulator, TrmB family [Methanosarcina sp. WWM596]AKB22121.1 Transcriptional regulator, TrmB family [Methanosarcina sp. WH1]
MTLKLIDNLQKLGFTGNEAKVYASLVCLKQAKASEIAENAGVPRPKIYGTLRGMEKKGYVRIIEGEPTLFCCVQPEVLILRIRADFMLSLSKIASELNSLTPGSNNFASESFNGERLRV